MATQNNHSGGSNPLSNHVGTRELRFRAWDSTNNEMLSWKELENDRLPQSFGIQLLQYTGMKDKNGIDIYEGDIVQNQAEAKREVRRTKYGEYKLFIGKHSDLFWKGWMPNTVWEVIGNVFENPELLTRVKTAASERPNTTTEADKNALDAPDAQLEGSDGK